MLTYGFAGNAKIAGMEKDLHLEGQDYAWILSIFFFGYVLAEVPSNLILSRCRPSVFLPAAMLSWGLVLASHAVHTRSKKLTNPRVISSLMAFANSTSTLLAFRFVLGVLESGFFPGVLFYLTSWYLKSELARRFALFYSAAALCGAFGGILAGAVTSKLHGIHGIAGWRYLFIIEGVGTSLFSVVAYFVLLDFPSTPSSRFSTKEMELAVLRLRQDGLHGPTNISNWGAIHAALKDWRTWAFTVLYMMCISSVTITYFIPTLMDSLGYKGSRAQYMTVPIYVFAATVSIMTGISADRFEPRRRYHVFTMLLFGFVGAVLATIFTQPAARYAMICAVASGLWGSSPLVLAWANNVMDSPHEKRAVVIAIINSIGNLSSVYGSRVWPAWDGPRFTIGFGTIAVFLGFGAVLVLILGAVFRRSEYKNAA